MNKITTQQERDEALDLIGEILAKDEEDPQDAGIVMALSDAIMEYDKRGSKIMNIEMGKGRYALVAGSWGSMFVACWLTILGVVELWPTAVFIVLFMVVGSLAPLYGKELPKGKDDS